MTSLDDKLIQIDLNVVKENARMENNFLALNLIEIIEHMRVENETLKTLLNEVNDQTTSFDFDVRDEWIVLKS